MIAAACWRTAQGAPWLSKGQQRQRQQLQQLPARLDACEYATFGHRTLWLLHPEGPVMRDFTATAVNALPVNTLFMSALTL